MLKTRTDRRKAAWFIETIGGGCALAALLEYMPRPWSFLLATICLVVIVVGVALQRLWGRQYFLGRRAQRQGDHASAVALFEGAITNFSQQLWKQHPLFVWHFWFSPYTNNVVAMLYNNQGVSYLRLGQLDGAQSALDRAIAIDALYPTAHTNLGLVALQHGDAAHALELFAEAVRLGDRSSALDALIRKTAAAWGELLAKGLTPT